MFSAPRFSRGDPDSVDVAERFVLEQELNPLHPRLSRLYELLSAVHSSAIVRVFQANDHDIRESLCDLCAVTNCEIPDGKRNSSDTEGLELVEYGVSLSAEAGDDFDWQAFFSSWLTGNGMIFLDLIFSRRPPRIQSVVYRLCEDLQGRAVDGSRLHSSFGGIELPLMKSLFACLLLHPSTSGFHVQSGRPYPLPG